jgi:HDOD domain
MRSAGSQAAVVEMVAGVTKLTSLPTFVTRVTAVLEDPRATIEQIVAVVELDAAFAIQLLRVANSAFFGASRDIDSLSKASPMHCSPCGPFGATASCAASARNCWRVKDLVRTPIQPLSVACCTTSANSSWPSEPPRRRERLEFWPNGTGQALIRRGKTDAEGQGRVAYLSRETVKWLKIWLDHAKISGGPIFRRLIGRDEIGEALHPGSIAPIFKRVAQWIGMPARFVAEVSRHSTRVGAAQDLAELDIDLAAITQAGGWKSTRMPLQYAEKINAARSGMARAAVKAGRD